MRLIYKKTVLPEHMPSWSTQTLLQQQTILSVVQPLGGFSEVQKCVFVCLWMTHPELNYSWMNIRQLIQRAAIIWTGLTGLLRGRPSKNTPYLRDSMMTLTSAAVSLLFQFPSRLLSLLLLFLVVVPSDHNINIYAFVSILQQTPQTHSLILCTLRLMFVF